MRKFDSWRRRQSRPKHTRIGLRPLLVLAALAALAVVLVPSGSAKPPPTPSGTYQACLIAGTGTSSCTAKTGGGDYSVVAGTGNTALQVTITNDGTSNQTLDWANVSVPATLSGLSIDTAYSPQLLNYTTYASTSTSSTLQLRGLGLAPGASKTVAFYVTSTVANCTDGIWATDARSSSTPSAFVFPNPPSKSGGLTSLVSKNCQLALSNEPSAALPTKTITSAPYSESGASVTVVTPSLPVALNGGGVTLGIQTGSFDSTDSFAGVGPVAFGSGSAAFSSLEASGTGGPFTLKASAAGFTDAVSSPPFAITKNGESCLPSTSCDPFTGTDAHGNTLIQVATSAGFAFLGSSPSAVPLDQNGSGPAGCQSWTPTPLGNGFVPGFVEFDGRTDAAHSSMMVTYLISQNAIKARYGKNVGQQFIPICIGAKRVDANGVAQDCTAETPTWQGDALDGNGAFTGGISPSACGPDGYEWDIISSFQDKLDQSVNPVVTAWSSTSIGGTTYRQFVMSIPAGWDLKGGI